MRQARIGAQARLDVARPEPERARGGPGGAGVLLVVPPRQAGDVAQVDAGHLPRLARLRKPALPRRHAPARAVEPAGGDADDPIVALRLLKLVGEVAPLVLVHPDHAALGPAFREQPPLGGEVAAKPAVPVEVIGREVGEDADVGGERAREVGLVARKLEHDDVLLARRVEVEHAAADVAGQMRPAPRLHEDVVKKRGGGGLAVRAGDADHPWRLALVPERAEEQADVVVHRHARVPRGADRGMRRGVEMRDAWRGDERRHALERAGLRRVAYREPLGLRRRPPLRAVVPGHHPGAPGPQRARRGEAGSPEAQHRDRFALVSGNGDHRPAAMSRPICRRASHGEASGRSRSPRAGAASPARPERRRRRRRRGQARPRAQRAAAGVPRTRAQRRARAVVAERKVMRAPSAWPAVLRPQPGRP